MLEWNWEKEEYKIEVAKQRHGEVGKNVYVRFLPEYSRFEDFKSY